MYRVIFILSILFIFVACASGHNEPFTDPPPLKRHTASIQNRLIDATSASSFLSLKKIGAVVYDEIQAPIWVVHFKNKPNPVYRVLISAGIHGNEPAGVESVVSLVEALSRTPQTYPDIEMHLIPVINPWGWERDIRFNREGMDINRDFASFNSQESKLIQSYIHKKEYHLMIDLHEDPSASGFYLYQYGRKDDTLSKRIVEETRQMGYPVEQDIKMVILKTQDGVIDAPMWGLWYMRLTRQLSITNYYRLKNSKHVFTIETPTSLDMKDRLVIHRNAVHGLINHLMTNNK